MDINWGLVAPLLVIEAILVIVALVDLIRIDETKGPKWMWVFIIIFITVLGPISYFIFGRRQD